MESRVRGTAPGPPSAAGPVLVVTGDAAVASEVERCAAGVGAPMQVVAWSAEALARWPTAAVVLLGDDVVAQALAAVPRRRDGVHLLCRGAPGGDQFRAGVELGVESVTALDGARAWLGRLLQERATPRAPGRVVAVVPGSGGAGATTTVAALAQVAAREGARVVVVDCDPWGAGLARVLGADDPAGVGWREIVASPGRIGPASLAEGVPRHSGVGVVTGAPDDLAVAVVRDVVEAARLGHDLVLVDLPRGRPDLAREVVARSDRSLVLVRPRLAGTAAAARQVEALGPGAKGTGVGLVLRGSGFPAATVVEAVGVPVVARLPEGRDVEEAVDLGLGPVRSHRGAWPRAVRGLLDEVTRGSGALR